MILELAIYTQNNEGKVNVVVVPKSVSSHDLMPTGYDKAYPLTLASHAEAIEEVYNRIKEVVSAYNVEQKKISSRSAPVLNHQEDGVHSCSDHQHQVLQCEQHCQG